MNRLRVSTIILITILACAALPATAQENLVVNGGFEVPQVVNAGFRTYPADTPGIGWSIQGYPSGVLQKFCKKLSRACC